MYLQGSPEFSTGRFPLGLVAKEVFHEEDEKVGEGDDDQFQERKSRVLLI